MNVHKLRNDEYDDDSTNQFGSTISLNTTASISSTNTVKPSKFYGNITIEMIDDFLNPKTRLNLPETEKKNQKKQITNSTTKGLGLIDFSSSEDESEFMGVKHQALKEKKTRSEFAYVHEHRHAYENELKGSSYRYRYKNNYPSTQNSLLTNEEGEASSLVGSGMSEIESVTTLNIAPSVHARLTRRIDRMHINDNPSLHEIDDELNEGVMGQINLDMNNNSNFHTPSEYEEALTNEIYKHYAVRDNYNKKLPITCMQERIINFIELNKFCIIQGGTGCGKSTQVPQYILDWHAMNKKRCNIIVTQPRRIAAMSVARRVCSEHNWTLGGTCGYQIGLDSKNVSIDTRITYCTTGVLLQKLIGDKAEHNFEKYTHIILDEVHERDLDTDFLLLIIKLKSLRKLKSKVILMSATIETERFAEYYRSTLHKAPILNINSSTYEVRDFYWEDLTDRSEFFSSIVQSNSRYFTDLLNRISSSNFSYSSSSLRKKHDISNRHEGGLVKRLTELDFNYDEPSLMSEPVAMVVLLLKYFDELENSQANNRVVIDGLAENRGSVLIFAPGMHEIQTIHEVITREMKDKKINLLPLHSDIVIEQQVQVFDRSKPFWRKVIISTSIAESSITVPDIKYVIDFCLTKEMYCDPFTNYTHLRLEWASQSSANQRRGRAGRVSDGLCFRLVTKRFYNKLKMYADPAMLREPLPRVILNTKRLKPNENPKKILSLAIQPPKASDIERTILMLKEVGALTLKSSKEDLKTSDDYLYDGDLTFAGTVMANLPIDIKLSKLILLGFAFGKLRETIIIAAALSTKTFFTCYFKSYLESYKAKWLWSQGWMCDCICILNAFNLWESLKAREHFQSKREQYEWTKNNMIQLERLREVEILKKEIEDRLKNINIHCEEYQHNSSNLLDKNCFDENEQTIKSNLILKLIIAGAFYPNYFNAHKVNIDEIPKMLSGKDPRNTVLVKNLPLNNGILYHQKLSDMFRVCSKQLRIHFEDCKALIEFKSKCEEVSSNINLGVYLAVQMRMLQLPMTLSKYNDEVSFQKMKKFNRERQLNSNLSVSFDKDLNGVLTLKVEESDDDSDLGGYNDNYDSDEEHHRFVTGQQSQSRLSLASSSKNESAMSTLARLNKTRPNLMMNRLTACNDTMTEHLSNPKYHFGSEIESYKNKLVDVCITEIVECAHFWCQIKDQSHIDTLLLIQTTLNKSNNSTLNASQISLSSTLSASSVNLKTVDPKNLYTDALCVTHYTDLETNESMYYRVRVLYVNREKYCCDVHFVDYGNKASRSFNELFELDQELKKHPFQAIECKLANIKLSILYNPNGVWTQISNKKFQNFLQDPMYDSFKIKLVALNNDHALVDLFGVKLNFKENDQSLKSVGDLLIDSHCADRYVMEDLSNSNTMSANDSMRDILYIPTRQSEYSSSRPTATSQNPNFKSKFRKLAIKKLDDLESIIESEAGAERFNDSDMDENDESLYSGKICLNGPYSPLEIKYYSLLNVGQCKKTRVERDSINNVCLDDDPYNDTNRLLVATSVSINPSGNCMILRKTTLMPKLRGLTALCCILFTPKMEIRMSPDESKYTGCICGLGYDPLTRAPVYADNDIELEFDINLDATDFQTINAVRMAINMIIGSQERVNSWSNAEGKLKDLQAVARDKLLKVIDREREAIEPLSFRKPNKWSQLPKNYQKMRYADHESGSFGDAYYSSHDIPILIPKK